MMKNPVIDVLLAADSFKGTLPSFRVGEAVEQGILRAVASQQRSHAYDGRGGSLLCNMVSSKMERGFQPARFIHRPMSDGGAGLMDSIAYKASSGAASLGSPSSSDVFALRRVWISGECAITDPLGSPRRQSPPLPTSGEVSGAELPFSFVCDVEKRVVIVEMADAAGLPRIADPSQRSPLQTTSYGVGEVLRHALAYLAQQRAHRECHSAEGEGITVFMGIGGSSTNDGGLGALQALGLHIFVKAESGGEELLRHPFRGGHLSQLSRVEISDELRRRFPMRFNSVDDHATGLFIERVFLICDVDNPLVGPRGATMVFGPQKCAPLPRMAAGKTRTEDAAVGEVSSEEQRLQLMALERGMEHAARRVVASTWKSMPESRHGTEDEALRELLHGAGGGGAGGMSGFFRYILRSACLPGADAVAALLNVRGNISDLASGNTSQQMLPLKIPCDVIVSGEGSFDVQTVDSHKTVGRLLEMVVESNLLCLVKAMSERHVTADHDTTVASFLATLKHQVVERRAVDSRFVSEFVIICGRCGFPSRESCQEAVQESLFRIFLPSLYETTAASTGLRTTESLVKKLVNDLLEQLPSHPHAESHPALWKHMVAAATPYLNILPLTPQPFTVREAMQETFRCVRERTTLSLCDPNGEKLRWKRPSSI